VEASQSGTCESRVYRLKWWLQGLSVLGAAIVGGLGALLVMEGADDALAVAGRARLDGIIGMAFVLGAIYSLARAAYAAVILDRDAVSSRGVFLTRTLQKSEIRGFTKFWNRGIAYMDILPKSSKLEPIRIELLFSFDAEWKRWISTLPDLHNELQKEEEARFGRL